MGFFNQASGGAKPSKATLGNVDKAALVQQILVSIVGEVDPSLSEAVNKALADIKQLGKGTTAVTAGLQTALKTVSPQTLTAFGSITRRAAEIRRGYPEGTERVRDPRSGIDAPLTREEASIRAALQEFIVGRKLGATIVETIKQARGTITQTPTGESPEQREARYAKIVADVQDRKARSAAANQPRTPTPSELSPLAEARQREASMRAATRDQTFQRMTDTQRWWYDVRTAAADVVARNKQAIAARPQVAAAKQQASDFQSLTNTYNQLRDAARQVGSKSFVRQLVDTEMRGFKAGTPFKEIEQQMLRLGEANKRVWTAYNQGAQTAQGTTKTFKSSLDATETAVTRFQAGMTSVGTIVKGVFIEHILEGAIRAVGDALATVADKTVEFAEGVLRINTNMQLLELQLKGLFDSAEAATAAMNYVKKAAVETPFFSVQDMVEAIRLMTAFGLNYQRWFPLVSGVAVAMGRDVGQVARAIGLIASGATGRGIYYLRLAGVNVQEAGVKFDSAGHAIEGTEVILEKLEAYLKDKFGAVIEETKKSWFATTESIKDQWVLVQDAFGKPSFEILAKKGYEFSQWLQKNQNEILAFASVLGEYPARAFQKLIDYVQQLVGGTGGGVLGMDPSRFFQGGFNIIVSFANGMIDAMTQYVIPAAFQIASTIASFLLGHSPAEIGPLAEAYTGALAIARTYIAGLKAGFDLSAIEDLASLVKAALDKAVSAEQFTESQAITLELQFRSAFGAAVLGIQQFGEVSGQVMDAVAAAFPGIFADIQLYLVLLGQLKAANDLVAAAERGVEAATNAVADAQDKLNRFERLSADIPERYTRGRKMELQDLLDAAQKREKAAQDQLKAAQEQTKEIQKQLDGLKAYFKELEQIMQLEAARIKALKKEEDQKPFKDTVPDLSPINEELEKFKKKWREWFEQYLEPQLRGLGAKLEQSFDPIIRGFLGLKPNLDLRMDAQDKKDYIEVYQAAAKFRKDLETIATESLPAIVRFFGDVANKIGEWKKEFDKLPEWVKTAIVSGIVLNFATGGLVGDFAGVILGGLITAGVPIILTGGKWALQLGFGLLTGALSLGQLIMDSLATSVLFQTGVMAFKMGGIRMLITAVIDMAANALSTPLLAAGGGMITLGAAGLLTLGLGLVLTLAYINWGDMAKTFDRDPETGQFKLQVILSFLLDPKTMEATKKAIIEALGGEISKVPGVGGPLSGLFTAWTTFWGIDAPKAVGNAAGDIGTKVGEISTGVQGGFNALWDALTRHSIIPDMMADIVWWFGDLFDQVVVKVYEGREKILQAFRIMLDAIGDALRAFDDMSMQSWYFESAWAGAFETFSLYLNGIVGQVWYLIQLLQMLYAYLGGGPSGNSTGSKLKGFATGVSYVPVTAPYVLHEGEMVFNKEQAAAMRSGGRMGSNASVGLNQTFIFNVPMTRADKDFLQKLTKDAAYEGIEAVMKKAKGGI